MQFLEKTILPIFLATVWVSISEFARNEWLLKKLWITNYSSIGLVFPSEPFNAFFHNKKCTMQVKITLEIRIRVNFC